ncbi:MAG TPA: translocation/assembly module TamB domain-containing protein [Steroidobacteraceae bacterium]|nr:translocation/assembly module TamB domain-containing protein [Steroidobacteraceae bacterium]
MRRLALILAFLNMRRALLVAACVIVAAAIAAPLTLVWSALFTNGGLQFVIRHIPQRFSGVQLSIVGVHGTVAEGLSVERVEIDHDLVHLRFERIEGRVALMPLMLQTLRVLHGSVGSALIQVKPRTRPPGPGPPVFLPRWMIISAEQAHVGSVTITVPNGFRLDATGIEGAAVIRHRVIRFFQAEALLNGQLRVNGIGELRAADPLGMEVKGRADWTAPGQPTWTVDGSARGDLNDLNIVAHVQNPFRADVSGQALDLTEHWHWAADATVRSFDLRAFGLPGSLGRISGHLAGIGNAAGFTAHGPLNPAGLHAGEFEAQFSGAYAQRTLTARQIELRHLASGARLHAAGSLAVDGPRLDVSGQVSDFRWPLVGASPVVSEGSGSFALAGALPYAVHVNGTARAAGLPLMPVTVSGTLGKERFAFDDAQIDVFGGHASLSGQVSWSPAETWSVSGRASGVNPGALREDLPGSVSFALGVSGRGFDTRGDLTASFSDLSGKLRGVAASGSGTLTRSGNTWGFSEVRVGLGSARLALDGHVSDRVDLRFAVSADDLSLLAPGMRGEIKASGTIAGTFADPVIVATAHGGDFDYQGVKLESLDADLDFDPGAAQRDSKIDARLHNLSYEGRTLESVALTLAGPPGNYRVRLALAATGLTARAETHGAYAHTVFQGELDALTVNGGESLHLSLERPVGLLVSPDQARVEWLCLAGTPGSLCADGAWSPQAWSTTVMSNHLPLKTLTAGMTPAVEYLGTINALARLAGGESTPLTGTLRAELSDAEIAHRLASHKVEHTRIGSGIVTLTASPALVGVEADLGNGEVGTVHARFEAQRITAGAGTRPEPLAHWEDMPLSGELHAQTAELGLISLYAPTIDRAAGHFNADIQLSGTAGTPRFGGAVKVSDGSIDVYQVNLALRQVQLNARLSDGGLDFDGSARAGAGKVTAGGHLEWHRLQPYGEFHLQGASLRVTDVPEAQIDASPDLDFTVSGRRIEVNGKVTVPFAKIQPRDITGAVLASQDEVIVGSEPEDPAKRFEVMSTITLALGDRVTVDTSGLTGRLTGGITIRSGYDAITRGTGELSVDEGKYTAYGRKLDIERGRLIFTGGPIDDPGIDVRAVKKFPDVTAGVNVRGTLLQPRMTFFSDPPLPQSQVVSLILAGGSLESAQNRAAAGTGGGAGSAALYQGAAILGQQIGSHVGIEDVSLESDITNETSLVLGRYLSPRLYVSYGISLTQQLNTLKLRYTLGDHWTIKTEVGQARGADLVYSIDK